MAESLEEPVAPAAVATPKPRRSGAPVVAAGILLSRLAGFLRVRATSYFFGVSPYADVLLAAFRAPNILQVLLGEGTLSASFIPVYARLEEEGRQEEAGRFAGAVLGLLLAVVSAAVLLGVVFAAPLVALLTPGFVGDAAAVAAGEATVDRYRLAVKAVRILFPMTGFIVLSVWALAILNSHRRFFLSYVSPVVWNSSIITALVWAGWGTAASAAGPDQLTRLLYAACFGGLVGGVLQFAVQLPLVFRLLRGFRLSFSTRVKGVREALSAFGPVVAGRGVVQLGGYLDLVLASLLATGAVSALGPALYLYMLPVSLFGMSVAAAELPELTRVAAGAEGGAGLPRAFVERIRSGLTQVAFLVVPTSLGYLAFGFLLVGALYRTGRFGLEDSWLVYFVLVGYSLGMVATTASRLLQNTFYALKDTRTPARVAVGRVVLAAGLAVPLMFFFDGFSVAETVGRSFEANRVGGALRLGAVGLSLASGLAAWLELALLRRSLRGRVEGFDLPGRRLGVFTALALAAAVPAAAVWWWLPALHPALAAAAVVGVYGLGYLFGAWRLGLPEMDRWVGRLLRRKKS